MTMKFGDQFYAAQFRDIINQMVDKRISELHPPERIGKVYSYNTGTQIAEILFPGETIATLVKAKFAKNMTPTLSMKGLFEDLGYNAPSDIVRVTGKPGNFWICDYVSGKPQSSDFFGNTYPARNEIKNGSFEDWQTAAPRNDNTAPPTTKMFPRNWSSFWNDGSWDVEPDRDPNNTIGGGTSVKITRKITSTSTAHRMTLGDTFLVTPGSIVEISVWAKTNLAMFTSARIYMTLLTNEFLADPQFFASGVSAPSQSYAAGNAWKRYTVAFRVPAGHYMARVDLQAFADLAEGEVSFWLDEVEVRSRQELVTPSGMITLANAVGYAGTGWQAIGQAPVGSNLTGGMTVSGLNLNFGGGLRVPRDGLYHVSLSAAFNAGTATGTTSGRRGIKVNKNDLDAFLIEDVRTQLAANAGRWTTSETIRLVKDDVLQFRIYTDVANHHGGFQAGARLTAFYIPGAD